MNTKGNVSYDKSAVLKGKLISVPQNDATLTKAGYSADAKVTGDRLLALEDKLLFFPNVTVPSVLWVADATYVDYPYRADIPLERVTEKHMPEVVFGANEISSGNYAPISETSEGIVTIYSKVNYSVTIPIIKCYKEAE